MIALSLGLTGGGSSLVGCHKIAADKTEQAAPNPDSVKQSYAALKKLSDDLQQNFSNLSKDVQSIPADMPAFPRLRSHFYEVEEARGVTDAKVTILSSRLDSALRSGKPEELQQVSNEIDKTSKDLQKIGALHVKLLHEVMAFQRVADDHKQALAAAASAKTKQAKSKH
ncbi:MAG TPA: hypothetical protein VLC06_01645 [Polyangia bacterium]|nr:hypothetical protein [Polyangia bacterium]